MTSVPKKKRQKKQNDYLNLKEEEEDTEKRVEQGGGRRGLRRSQGQEIVWERSRVKVELTCLSIGVH